MMASKLGVKFVEGDELTSRAFEELESNQGSCPLEEEMEEDEITQFPMKEPAVIACHLLLRLIEDAIIMLRYNMTHISYTIFIWNIEMFVCLFGAYDLKYIYALQDATKMTIALACDHIRRLSITTQNIMHFSCKFCHVL